MTSVRHMTWHMQVGKEAVRKNATEGMEAAVEGWADYGCRRVLIKVLMNLAGDGLLKEVTHNILPRNIQLTSEYLDTQELETLERLELGGDRGCRDRNQYCKEEEVVRLAPAGLGP